MKRRCEKQRSEEHGDEVNALEICAAVDGGEEIGEVGVVEMQLEEMCGKEIRGEKMGTARKRGEKVGAVEMRAAKGMERKLVQWKSMKIKCDDVEMCEEDVQREDEKQKKKTQIAYNLMEVLTIRR